MKIEHNEIKSSTYFNTYIIDAEVFYDGDCDYPIHFEVSQDKLIQTYLEFLGFTYCHGQKYHAFQKAKDNNEINGFNWLENMPLFSKDDRTCNFNYYEISYYDKEGRQYNVNVPEATEILNQLKEISTKKEIKDIPLMMEKLIEKVLLDVALKDSNKKTKSIKV